MSDDSLRSRTSPRCPSRHRTGPRQGLTAVAAALVVVGVAAYDLRG